MKKFNSIVLLSVVLISTFVLPSCARFIKSGGDLTTYLPDWYIGGYFGVRNEQGAEYYWVETYDEVLSAIDKLQSHGSTFDECAIATYDGDLFDVKYCFTMRKSKAEKITYGEDPFDRKCEEVKIHSVAFFEDVSIDELVRGYVFEFDCYEISASKSWSPFKEKDLTELERKWTVREDSKGFVQKCEISLDKDNSIVILSNKASENKDTLTDECVDSILNSIVFIGQNAKQPQE